MQAILTADSVFRAMRGRLVSCALLASLVLFAWTAGVANAANPVLDRVNASGTLRVAMSAAQPPYSMKNGGGEVIGYDVDLAGALARVMDLELAIVELPFGELFAALADGRADLAISGISITPERTLSMGFVGPYTFTGKSILTTTRIRDVARGSADFNDAGIRIAALGNSTSERFVERQLPLAELYAITNYDEGIGMLLTGRVDAMVADVPILQLALLRYPEAGLAMIEPPLSVEPIGIAIAGNDEPFRNLVEIYLRALENTGVVGRIQSSWLEDNSWIAELPRAPQGN